MAPAGTCRDHEIKRSMTISNITIHQHQGDDMTETALTAAESGTFALGGDLVVNRLGYGTMQLTGGGVGGPPCGPNEALQVLRRAVELGVNLIDATEAYGPTIAEPLIRQALFPYPDDLVIATKAGFTRQCPNKSTPVGRPECLRKEVEMSLRHLALERIDLLQLHRIDPKVALEDQVGELKSMQAEGKIRHIGLTEVSVSDVEAASKIATIVSVQNLFNLANRTAEPLLKYATERGIAFIPWFPLATGALVKYDGPLATLSQSHGASPAQLALAWLLKQSPAVLPIPGTSSVAHVEDNVAAAAVRLTDDEAAELTKAV
jgi:pyridoxine 4-dehydrogenase